MIKQELALKAYTPICHNHFFYFSLLKSDLASNSDNVEVGGTFSNSYQQRKTKIACSKTIVIGKLVQA